MEKSCWSQPRRRIRARTWSRSRAEEIFRGSAPLRERDRGSVSSWRGFGLHLTHVRLWVINLVSINLCLMLSLVTQFKVHTMRQRSALSVWCVTSDVMSDCSEFWIEFEKLPLESKNWNLSLFKTLLTDETILSVDFYLDFWLWQELSKLLCKSVCLW